MKIDVLTLFRMGLIGAAHGWGQNGLSSKNLSHISYNNEIWHSLPHLLSLQKYINHVAYPLRSADISIFSTEISSFCYIKKLKFKLHFNTWFLILVTLFQSLKLVLWNMVAILMMPAKLANAGLWRNRFFPWRRQQKSKLSPGSYYIADVVMWPKSIINSIFLGIWPEKPFFEGALVQVQ